ncbi:MAG: helix-turn-helix domain-containing protein, partial [Treponema sp.]|nr:helix-turn-helix domain-containing protein [Treponema sp.]
MKTETHPPITEEELSIMKKIAGSGKLRSKFAIRLLVIINRAEGKPWESISESLGISLSSVIRYIKRFNREGMESRL